LSLHLSPGQKVALYEILHNAKMQVLERRPKGPVTRGAVDFADVLIEVLEVGPGASVTIVRDEV
jgi:hypothetical protein